MSRSGHELLRALAVASDGRFHRSPGPPRSRSPTPPEAAAELLLRARPRAGTTWGSIRSVLDLGCGPGTLAIGAALLGARRSGRRQRTPRCSRSRDTERRARGRDRPSSSSRHRWRRTTVPAETVVMNPPVRRPDGGTRTARSGRRRSPLARRRVYAFSLAASRTFIADTRGRTRRAQSRRPSRSPGRSRGRFRTTGSVRWSSPWTSGSSRPHPPMNERTLRPRPPRRPPRDRRGVRPGRGTYEDHGRIYAALLGRRHVDPRDKAIRVEAIHPIPHIGEDDVVYARVDEVKSAMAICTILSLASGRRAVPGAPEGTVHISKAKDGYTETPGRRVPVRRHPARPGPPEPADDQAHHRTVDAGRRLRPLHSAATGCSSSAARNRPAPGAGTGERRKVAQGFEGLAPPASDAAGAH